MLSPQESTAPMPTKDMPKNVAEDFAEARNVLNESPRSAVALLRLSIQKLMIHLGEKGTNINDDIGHLVKKGLAPRIQKALDIVRVTGNNAVHPGEMNIKDDPKTAITLFKLVNMIVDQMITQPKELTEMYNELPEGAKKGIVKRDGKK